MADTEVAKNENADATLTQEGTQPAQKVWENDIDYAKRIKEVEAGAKKVAEKANKYEKQIAHTTAVKDAYREIRKDTQYLIKLAKENPQVAKDVCEEYYDMTLSQALAKVQWEEVSNESKTSDKMLQTYISDYIEGELEEVDADDREKIKDEYDDIVSGKNIESIKDAKKYLLKAKQLAWVTKKPKEDSGSSIMWVRGKTPLSNPKLGNNSPESYKRLRAMAIEQYGKEKGDIMYPIITWVTE